VRYASQKAEETLGVKWGWRDQAKAELLREDMIGEEAMTLIHDSLNGQRRERHIRLPRDDGNTRYWETTSDVIQDSHEQTLGAFIRIKDVTFAHKMFGAFSLIAEAKDKVSVLQRILLAGSRLEFKWGRLYLVDPQDPKCLVSHDFFGNLPQDLQEKFRNGGIRMPRRKTPGKESWACLDMGRPLVFYYDPNLEDGGVYKTRRGQEAYVVNAPRFQVELDKHPGDFWVDLPLRAQDGQPIGKVTFEWNEDRWPREFDLVNALAEMVSRVIEAFQARELEEERMQAVRSQTAQKIMAEVAHNIGTQLGALPALLRRYKNREKDLPALQELNRRFATINEETSRIITRAKERLIGVSPKPSWLNLKECLQNTLQSFSGDICSQVKCSHDVFEIQADGYLLKQVLYELIQNSKDVAGDKNKSNITISLDFERRAEGEVARITYRDNGPGVPVNFKERIFEDFFTYHPGGVPGTGLGMGFVRRVAEAHGGKIIECGVPGKGVEFVITLPVKQMSETPETVSEEQLPLLFDQRSTTVNQ
jgi:signal transduction histidine kinase